MNFSAGKIISKFRKWLNTKDFFLSSKGKRGPTLDPAKRNNFTEVELGYASEEIAQNETQRCLECGCTAVYTCDLKKYSSQYGASQENLKGDFREYSVDFRHPYIEIDSNKCISAAAASGYAVKLLVRMPLAW